MKAIRQIMTVMFFSLLIAVGSLYLLCSLAWLLEASFYVFIIANSWSLARLHSN